MLNGRALSRDGVRRFHRVVALGRISHAKRTNQFKRLEFRVCRVIIATSQVATSGDNRQRTTEKTQYVRLCLDQGHGVAG